MNAPTVEEIVAIVLADYGYWRDIGDGGGEDLFEISMGGIGAAANIYAAMHGNRSPWHPQKPEET